MTLNDFKSVEGDRRMNIDSLPVLLGVVRAARLACWTMAASQVIVIVLLLQWDATGLSLVVAAMLSAQGLMMPRFIADPVQRATWYSGFGVTLYVVGMLVSAFALRTLGAA